ncbi:MAG TPA: hydantoinase/oxoprolinase family protein [Candidatus Limnocylindria bacterium]|nr:hydantoinase/oxoprolinase family protein [Candidatus Limnocylindria bacterium]
MSERRLRIGIDVGGTFTDVVAVDAATRALVAAVKVPTTHRHPEGVAAGIVAGLERLLREHAIVPESIAFIAHSTTQATNALLEGDVAKVGVVTLGGRVARTFARFKPFAIAEGVRFAPLWFDGASPDVLESALAAKVEALAVSEPFAVDRPQHEAALVAAARARGLAATSGAEVSAQYGLRARTRTAALNAAILPRMLRTSRVTARAVADARIPAPLMIMRSDGGVMDVAEVERRPILTMLSGPAAGIAGALFHENVTDGIFVEVGGTSADCSVIRRGQPQMRPARIGGHRTLLRTLDVRTIAVAGGSLVHLADGRVGEIGPRSAHIAGYEYAAFSPEALVASARADLADGIAALVAADGTRIAITPTCAANVLGTVPAGAFARGDAAAARAGCALVAQALGTDAESFARAVLDRATERLRLTLDELLADYGLDRATTVLVGGGGGAAALVPYAASKLGFAHRIAHDAEVISPVGVALALVRDVVERTIVDPSAADLARIRREAIDAAIASGAAPERVEVVVEVDTARNRVRATASGATALVEGAAQNGTASDEERRAAAALHLRSEAEALLVAARTPVFTVFAAQRESAVVDERGVVRLVLAGAVASTRRAAEVAERLPRLIEEQTRFGDVGRALPDVFLLRGARIAEFSGLGEAAQICALADEELAGVADDEPIAIVLVPARA